MDTRTSGRLLVNSQLLARFQFDQEPVSRASEFCAKPDNKDSVISNEKDKRASAFMLSVSSHGLDNYHDVNSPVDIDKILEANETNIGQARSEENVGSAYKTAV